MELRVGAMQPACCNSGSELRIAATGVRMADLVQPSAPMISSASLPHVVTQQYAEAHPVCTEQGE